MIEVTRIYASSDFRHQAGQDRSPSDILTGANTKYGTVGSLTAPPPGSNMLRGNMIMPQPVATLGVERYLSSLREFPRVTRDVEGIFLPVLEPKPDWAADASDRRNVIDTRPVHSPSAATTSTPRNSSQVSDPETLVGVRSL